MKRQKFSCVLAMVAAAATPVLGQVAGHEQLLLPIYVADTPGAFGSRWTTELWLRNDGDMPALIYPLTTPHRYPPPRSTTEPSFYKALPGEPQGVLIHVDPAFRSVLHFNLRVRDVSRQALTWGTELPIVSEHEFASGTVVLVNVPLRTGFRAGLRIYESRARGLGTAVVRIFDDGVSGVPIIGVPPVVETIVALPSKEPAGGPTIYWPGYAQMLDLQAAFPQLRDVAVARIEVEPVGDATRIWAFVSVTNNETQHVTTITPQ